MSGKLREFSGATLLAALALSFAASHAQTAPVAPGGPYRIAGKVVNATTGQPVRHATIGVLAEEDSHLIESMQTDNDGRFLLDHLPAGKYPLTASKRGYRTSFFDEHDEYNSAIVTGPDQDPTHLTFRLTPNSVLYGVVTGDGGDPVEGASVLLFERGGEHGTAEDRINEVDAVTTDDTGAYEFPGLAAGEYLIAVSAQPWYAMHSRRDGDRGEASPLDVAYPVTYYDSTMDEASATPIKLAEGGRQQADINLHAVPALRLQVAVPRRRSGLARPELRKMVFGVQVAAESSGFIDAAQTGSTEFTGLAPGRYQLMQGDPPRVTNFDLSASQDVDPNSGTPAVSIDGALINTNGAPVTGVSMVALEPVGESHGRATVQAPVHQGTFHFDSVESGTWALSAIGTTNAKPVIAVGVGGRSTAIGGNQLAVKDQPVAVTGIVSETLSRVQGFARDDNRKGMAGAMIVLVPRQPEAYRALLRRDESDSDGSFNLRDVPPGQYTVIAIEDGWKLDWSQRANLSPYLKRGVSITIPSQGAPIVTLPQSVIVQPR